MTHYFTGARVAVLVALSLVLTHCQSGEVTFKSKKAHNAATDEEDLEDDGTGADGSSSGGTPAVPREDPMLTFTFDGRALHARIRENVAQGASLVANVFAARNGEDRSAVDCTTLKSVDVSKAQPFGAGRWVDVPSDTSFLAKRLDGTTRTVIHGCLLDAQGQVVTRVSTSLMNAWDSDPNVAAANPRIFHGIEAYTNACIDELGEIPMFEGGKEFDCRDPSMQVVPITATDTSGRVVSITKDTPWPLGAAEQAATQRCDRPAWLDYGGQGASQCAPFTRIGRYTNSKGSRFVLICRRYSAASPTDANFDIVGLIAHNPQSGKTCWLNRHDDGSARDASRMPPPNTPTADRFWMNMDEVRGQGCPKCHDSDPFVHTPWMDQNLDADGRVLVPRMGDDSAYTLTTKYSTFARESFVGRDAESQAAWRHTQHLTNIGACGSCHRIGTGSTLQGFAARSVGDASDASFQNTWLTSAFRTFAKLHWMPTSPVTQAEWAASPNGQSMRLIASCASNPSACAVQDVPR